MKALALFFMVFALSAPAADYGVKTRFAKGRTLVFPDCELTFAGTRKVSSAVYSRGFLYFDFKAAAGGRAKDVSWTIGTGDIGPVFFEIGGKKFVLELSHSDAFKGWLKDDELVLWPSRMFQKLKN